MVDWRGEGQTRIPRYHIKMLPIQNRGPIVFKLQLIALNSTASARETTNFDRYYVRMQVDLRNRNIATLTDQQSLASVFIVIPNRDSRTPIMSLTGLYASTDRADHCGAKVRFDNYFNF